MKLTTQSIGVITAITNDRDNLRDDQVISPDVRFIAYVDRKWGSKTWEERVACAHSKSARRNARIQKILVHHFVDCAYSIWVDGSVALRRPAKEIVEIWLQDADVATFRHRTRVSTYSEAEVCLERGLDASELISAQMARYRSQNFRDDQTLAETCVVIRKHNKRTELFNAIWWSEISAYSVRDQLSFSYAAWAADAKVNYITPPRFENSCFDDRPHPSAAEAPTH